VKTFKQFLEADGCWDGYKRVGMKKKGNRLVPNCVPEENVEERFQKTKTMKDIMRVYGRELKQAERTGNIDKHLSKQAEDALKIGVFKNEPYIGDDPDDFDEWLDDNLEDIVKGKIRESAEVEEGSETWEDGFKRRVVKTTKPEHKKDGYNWRIKGKDKDNLSIKLYKNKPDFAEFKKQMKRVAGHEFGG
jgi:hypothetical protein